MNQKNRKEKTNTKFKNHTLNIFLNFSFVCLFVCKNRNRKKFAIRWLFVCLLVWMILFDRFEILMPKTKHFYSRTTKKFFFCKNSQPASEKKSWTFFFFGCWWNSGNDDDDRIGLSLNDYSTGRIFFSFRSSSLEFSFPTTKKLFIFFCCWKLFRLFCFIWFFFHSLIWMMFAQKKKRIKWIEWMKVNSGNSVSGFFFFCLFRTGIMRITHTNKNTNSRFSDTKVEKRNMRKTSNNICSGSI